jgi:cysteine desulfurase/selenocysteine lyase
MYTTQATRREMLRLGLACSAGLLAKPLAEPGASSSIDRKDRVLNAQPWTSSRFPALNQLVNGKRLIYFDTAATAQRPREVIDALTEFYSRDNGNPAPNLHSLAKRSFEAYENARATVATLLNASDPLEIVWTRGTTEAINLVASSWGEANIGSNDEIVLTIAEHSSNMLPWQLLAKRKGARVRYVDVLDDGNLDLASLKLQVTQRTKLVCFPHVSNVLGIINPADEICRIAHQVGAKVLIDAAQSVPHFALDVQQLECDFLAFSGHKIMGPMGIGVLWARRSILDEMQPYQAGSNMAHGIGRDEWQYSEGARKFGAGTPNVSGTVGLVAAINFVRSVGYQQMWHHEQLLTTHLRDVLLRQKGVRILGGLQTQNRICLFCFSVDSIQAEELARRLDLAGIALRAGDMASLPLLQRFGANQVVRASLYLYNTKDEIDTFARELAAAVSNISGGFV